MRLFRNSELVKLYNISDKSVRNWIESAKAGKNGLELCSHNGRTFIADTLHNVALLEELVRRGRKYRNELSFKKIVPTPDFYELYTPIQVLDIIKEIDTLHEYPLSYRYLGSGARYWDAYLHKLYVSATQNLLTETIKLLELNLAWLETVLINYKHVNVVDVGVGNGLAAKGILEHIYKTGKLRRYAGIDISPDLLDITDRNIQKWFNGTISMEKYIRDISHERFTDILAVDSFHDDASSTINIVLFLGGTIMSFKQPEQIVRTIRDSMGKEDLLLSTVKLDSDNARRFFDFNTRPDKGILPDHHAFMLKQLSIDESMYEAEQFFDEGNKARFIQVRMKTTVRLHFDVGDYQKEVELRKGEALLLVRVRHFSDRDLINLYADNGFYLLQALKSLNEEYLLMALRVSAA